MAPGKLLWHWLAAPLAGIAIAPFPSSLIAHEPPRPSPSLQLAIRKAPDCALPADEATQEPTLATLVNIHSGEAVVLSRHEPTMDRVASLLADRVTTSQTPMDPRLMDLLRELASDRAPVKIEIVSGYRSWKLNELLRKKGRRVASHSQHSEGKAVDFRIEGMTATQMRDAIEAAGWNGGLGYYPKSADRFVHADTGPKRKWIGR